MIVHGVFSCNKNNLSVSTDKKKINIEMVHNYLTHSSWAEGINKDTVENSIKNSLCFSLYNNNDQIGFARIITDYATFGYLCDVFILDNFQGQGISRWFMECCLEHSDIKKLRRLMLVTLTAPWLYEKIGFKAITNNSFAWELVKPNLYKKN